MTFAKVTPLRGRRIAGSVFLELALAARSLPPGAARARRLRERVVRRAGELLAPRGTRTTRAAETAWRTFAPGVEFRIMRADRVRGLMTAFVRMRPGSTFEAHDHARREHCFVVDGDIRIGAHRLQRGDWHVADAGTRHAATHSDGGALLVVHAALPAGTCSY